MVKETIFYLKKWQDIVIYDDKVKNLFPQVKIYKIEPISDHKEGDIYIGTATKKYLCQRIIQHRNQYKNWLLDKDDMTTSLEIFYKYGLKVRLGQL